MIFIRSAIFPENRSMASEINLGAAELINSLRAGAQPTRRSPTPFYSRRRIVPRLQLLPAPRTPTRTCRCGACARCADNARWEAIFAKKFADPDYYSRPMLRHSSSLNGD